MKNKSFYALFTGNFLAQLGDSFYIIALISFIYNQTGSATISAVIPVLRVMAQVLSGLLTPFLIDQFPLKALLVSSQACQTSILLLLTMATNSVSLLLILTFIISFFDGWIKPCRNSLIPSLVPKSQIFKANSFINSFDQVIQLIGWSTGGLFIVYFGEVEVLLATVSLFLISTLLLSVIKTRSTLEKNKKVKEAKLKKFLSGWLLIWNNKVLKTIVAMDIIETFAGSIWIGSIILVFVKENLHQSESWWGFINATNCGGMILGSLVALLFSKKMDHKLRATIFASSLSVCILTTLFAINTNPWFALGISLLMGIPYQIRDITQQTFFQTSVSYTELPKVYSVHGILNYSAFGLSVLMMGFISDYFGVQKVYIVASFLYGLSALMTRFLK
ncbi:MFS transporter [Bacillus sp. WMMC1349]|uniref:MFS transporter n=1 Tax=Bacillus sp. WMMC1349 TaxID=2736254 RepID=UPI001557DC31|nr:MFS transporter [Bacillus sp. WMMC1349]NPC93215.1 MFS transporter [Bacillus sp. WMMC1349]